MRVLTVNAGSSSLKLALLGDDYETLAAEELSATGQAIDPDALRRALDGALAEADLAAHRIVHGGPRFANAARIDGDVERELRALTELAPLHQPKSLAALDAVTAQLPDLPAIACFDTTFHATIPEQARTYALPAEWRERWPIRRYGFHGLSHAWIARRAPELLSDRYGSRQLRIVSAHLGSGASLCAISGGRSIDTTMGFTPLEGLVMATRSGSVDPGLLLWLLEHQGIPASEVSKALEHASGLTGLAGSPDLKAVLRAAANNDKAAGLAVEVYVHRLTGAIGQMSVSLGGIDVLAFTGGVGENAPEIRQRTAAALEFLGVEIDQQLNEAAGRRNDQDLSAPGASVRTVVIHAREDLEMAREARLAVGA